MTVKLRESTGTLVDPQVESKSGKKWRIKVIEAGQGSSAYYPDDVLRDYASVFQPGTHMYFDHPSKTEESDRPERSVRDLAGRLVSEAEYKDGALYADVEFLPWAAPVVDALHDMVGVSIRAYGTVKESDDGPVLTAFQGVESVDVVTKAGAGGMFVELLESARPKDLTESEPVTTQKEKSMTPEQEAKLDALVESISSLTEQFSTVAESLAKAPEPVVEETAPESGQGEQVDPLEVAEALAESGLTKAGKALVVERVKAGVDLTEALDAQKEYEAQVRESAGGVHIVSESRETAKVPFKTYAKVGA